MKKLAFVITTPPNSNLTATAINMVTAALKSGIDVVGVFFYQDGVLNGSQLLALPNDEYQAHRQWQQLHHDYSLPLHLCATAAEKRGLSDDVSDSQVDTIHQAFTLSGLGELVELNVNADRLIQL
ncbi:sulfurtransferase complex subunit TusD [Colwellia hornerae]|uniref:Sulfurtransferase complex subunit TusD n=1 Tax=Colwellia hornerae TaxID=89402 RepID=A0A5C6Q3F0_9GAMM|nr:sulfurtransferase complex subunit TusD [Colwellia hornerae]TWX52191.1 sulfurtransferase complex subunit TusD [Colwellia hornerae]TWX57540.1 sulfurtransferase complex subunit TusD [Colwellia hornerae]TWX63359.1 sulfurtransferase complex subunit TusD [Colwellia hornerae]